MQQNKNDVLGLENARFSYLLAVRDSSDLKLIDIHFLRNVLQVKIEIISSWRRRYAY